MKNLFLLFLVAWLLGSCKTGKNLFINKTLHEQYAQKLTNAGLAETALGSQWFSAAGKALSSTQSITLPYKEVGYFPAEKPRALGLRFSSKRGEKIQLRVNKKPATNFAIYAELWRVNESGQPKLVQAADSIELRIEHEVENDGNYIVRLQPELLQSGEYTLVITTAPTLNFPVTGGKIGSFWGDDRDAGARRHEGVDIFAPKRTPAIAGASGTITSVREGGLGGRVIFMRPDGKNYSLYYAHLDEQLKREGDKVAAGEIIGLVGNTGNAATTSPHLHFGIYADGGAVNPLPFIEKKNNKPVEVSANESLLRSVLKTSSIIKNGINSYTSNTIVYPLAAAGKEIRVEFPDGFITSLPSTMVKEATKPLGQSKTKSVGALYEKPHLESPKISELPNGSGIQVLGYFKDFSFVRSGDNLGWLNSNVH